MLHSGKYLQAQTFDLLVMLHTRCMSLCTKNFNFITETNLEISKITPIG